MSQEVSWLSTEQNNPRTLAIDTVDTLSVLRMIHEEDRRAVEAMAEALPTLAAMADAIAERLQNGGRLYYVGAGTSGRIGVLDASELPATYGVSPSLVTAVIPGGYDTVYDARLGDEDDRESARADLERLGVCEKDAVVGIAASGRTPYTHEALLFAASRGSFTGAIVNVHDSQLASVAKYVAVIDTGAEAIQGSTRMKAGTTQKLALNMLSTAVMIRLGKVYQNKMVEITAINEKMVVRCEQMLMELTGASQTRAATALKDAEYHVKTAAAMLLCHCDAATAKQRLQDCDGRLAALL